MHHGVLTYADGSAFEGSFFENQPHGGGFWTDARHDGGRRYEAEFSRGKRVVAASVKKPARSSIFRLADLEVIGRHAAAAPEEQEAEPRT